MFKVHADTYYVPKRDSVVSMAPKVTGGWGRSQLYFKHNESLSGPL